MSSAAQISAGILILGAAFIIGNQLRNHGDDSNMVANVDNSPSTIVLQKTESSIVPQQQPPNSNELIELPIAKRRVSPTPGPPDSDGPIEFESRTSAGATNAGVLKLPPPPSLAADSILVEVEPDFSYLESLSQTVEHPVLEQPVLENTTVEIPGELLKVRRGIVESVLNKTIPIQPILESAKIPDRDLASPQLAKKIPVEPVTEEAERRVTIINRPKLLAMSGLVPLKPKSRNRIVLETNQFVRHQTESGETLQKLSIRYYGKPDYYLDIYLANQDVLENPANVPAGTTLRIPLYE